MLRELEVSQRVNRIQSPVEAHVKQSLRNYDLQIKDFEKVCSLQPAPKKKIVQHSVPQRELDYIRQALEEA